MRPMLRATVVTILVAAGLLGPVAASAGAEGPWIAAEITGPAGTTRVAPAAINAAGVVVGAARFPGHTQDTAFRWENGTMTELQQPVGSFRSRAADVNDAGVIVGSADFPTMVLNSGVAAVRWTATGSSSVVTKLPYNFTGVEDFSQLGSAALGINEQGLITGGAGQLLTNPSFWATLPFQSGGGSYTWLNLNPANGAADRTSGNGYQINESGAVLANGALGPDRAALFTAGVPAIFDIQPGLQGLNDLGHIVGTRSYLAGQTQTARMWNGSSYEELGGDQPTTPSMANAINNSDWAVGRSGVDSYQLSGGTAYLWRPNAPPTPLQSLAPAGWSFSQATDVNDDGVIVGQAFHSKDVGFTLTPAGLAYELTGTVKTADGAGLPGVSVQVLRPDGQEVAAPVVTAANGTYKWTLPPGSYRVTALPDNAYAVVANSACTIVGAHCDIQATRNRVVDFTRPGSTTGTGSAGGPGTADTVGPSLRIPARNRTITATAAGLVRFRLGKAPEDLSGSIRLSTAGTPSAAAAGAKKAKPLALGSRRFSGKSGKDITVQIQLNAKARTLLRQRRTIAAVAAIQARDLSGNTTTPSYKFTLKAAARRR